jgi:hypothetical protein
MIVLDVIAILMATALGVSFYRSKECFIIWLFESTGFVGYLLKAICLSISMATLIRSVDWSILMYKIF